MASPEICFQFPFATLRQLQAELLPDSLQPLLHGRTPAAPGSSDALPSSVLTPAAKGSSSSQPSSASARSAWSLTDPGAVAAPVRPSPSPQGARHPQRVCRCVSTPALPVLWFGQGARTLRVGGTAAHTQPRLKGQRAINLAGRRGGPGLQGRHRRAWQKREARGGIKGKAKPGRGWLGCRSSQAATGREVNHNDMVGRSCLRPCCTAGILVPPAPPQGRAGVYLPIWVQDSPLAHQAGGSCLVRGVYSSQSHIASKTMVSGGKEELGAFLERVKCETQGSHCLRKRKGLTPHKRPHQDRPDAPQPEHREKAFTMPGGRESIHRAQDLQAGL